VKQYPHLMHHSLQTARLALVTAMLVAFLAPSAQADDDTADDTVNTGQDITKPLTRVDLRLGRNETPSARNSTTFILRSDKPVALTPDWKLALRIDVPIIDNNVFTPDNPGGGNRFGIGDLLGQVLLIHPIDKRQAFGFGAQFILPTASQYGLGAGKVRVVPTAGYRYGLPEISPGSFAVFAMRYDVDIAGADSRQHISNLQFSPTLNIALPNQTFVTLFPSTDIRYDFLEHSWFVPFNLQIGKLWGRSIVTSLEGAVPMYKGAAPLYNYRVEARIGFFF
jgi:hypothetical protein